MLRRGSSIEGGATFTHVRNGRPGNRIIVSSVAFLPSPPFRWEEVELSTEYPLVFLPRRREQPQRIIRACVKLQGRQPTPERSRHFSLILILPDPSCRQEFP